MDTGASPVGDGGVERDEARLNADSDDGSQTHDPGKMFIGGLSWQTTAGKISAKFTFYQI